MTQKITNIYVFAPNAIILLAHAILMHDWRKLSKPQSRNCVHSIILVDIFAVIVVDSLLFQLISTMRFQGRPYCWNSVINFSSSLICINPFVFWCYQWTQATSWLLYFYNLYLYSIIVSRFYSQRGESDMWQLLLTPTYRRCNTRMSYVSPI